MASIENNMSDAGDKKNLMIKLKKKFNKITKLLNLFPKYIYAHVLYTTSYQFYFEINEKKKLSAHSLG